MKRLIVLILLSFLIFGCTQAPSSAPSSIPISSSGQESVSPSSLSNYYDQLAAACPERGKVSNDGGACCRQSVNELRTLKVPAVENEQCPNGSSLLTPRCIGAYSFCQPLPSALASQKPIASTSPIAGLANPAVVHCTGLGFNDEIVDSPPGQSGQCVFSDGSACDDWAFFRGSCGQKFSACVKRGGTLGAKLMGPSGVVTSNSTCQFKDGSICEESDLTAGSCKPGQQTP